MSTADKLNKLLETKAAIKKAIINKGVDVADDTVFADYPAKIDAIEADLETIELVHSIQEAIKMLQEEIERIKGDLNENFSLGLLDNLWILNGFDPILEEFANKRPKSCNWIFFSLLIIFSLSLGSVTPSKAFLRRSAK